MIQREELTARFANVHKLAELNHQLSVVSVATPVRMTSTEHMAELGLTKQALAAEFGSLREGERLVKAFGMSYPTIAHRIDLANVGSHPAVNVAIARIMKNQET